MRFLQQIKSLLGRTFLPAVTVESRQEVTQRSDSCENDTDSKIVALLNEQCGLTCLPSFMKMQFKSLLPELSEECRLAYLARLEFVEEIIEPLCRTASDTVSDGILAVACSKFACDNELKNYVSRIDHKNQNEFFGFASNSMNDPAGGTLWLTYWLCVPRVSRTVDFWTSLARNSWLAELIATLADADTISRHFRSTKWLSPFQIEDSNFVESIGPLIPFDLRNDVVDGIVALSNRIAVLRAVHERGSAIAVSIVNYLLNDPSNHESLCSILESLEAAGTTREDAIPTGLLFCSFLLECDAELDTLQAQHRNAIHDFIERSLGDISELSAIDDRADQYIGYFGHMESLECLPPFIKRLYRAKLANHLIDLNSLEKLQNLVDWSARVNFAKAIIDPPIYETLQGSNRRIGGEENAKQFGLLQCKSLIALKHALGYDGIRIVSPRNFSFEANQSVSLRMQDHLIASACWWCQPHTLDRMCNHQHLLEFLSLARKLNTFDAFDLFRSRTDWLTAVPIDQCNDFEQAMRRKFNSFDSTTCDNEVQRLLQNCESLQRVHGSGSGIVALIIQAVFDFEVQEFSSERLLELLRRFPQLLRIREGKFISCFFYSTNDKAVRLNLSDVKALEEIQVQIAQAFHSRKTHDELRARLMTKFDPVLGMKVLPRFVRKIFSNDLCFLDDQNLDQLKSRIEFVEEVMSPMFDSRIAETDGRFRERFETMDQATSFGALYDAVGLSFRAVDHSNTFYFRFSVENEKNLDIQFLCAVMSWCAPDMPSVYEPWCRSNEVFMTIESLRRLDFSYRLLGITSVNLSNPHLLQSELTSSQFFMDASPDLACRTVKIFCDQITNEEEFRPGCLANLVESFLRIDPDAFANRDNLRKCLENSLLAKVGNAGNAVDLVCVWSQDLRFAPGRGKSLSRMLLRVFLELPDDLTEEVDEDHVSRILETSKFNVFSLASRLYIASAYFSCVESEFDRKIALSMYKQIHEFSRTHFESRKSCEEWFRNKDRDANWYQAPRILDSLIESLWLLELSPQGNLMFLGAFLEIDERSFEQKGSLYSLIQNSKRFVLLSNNVKADLMNRLAKSLALYQSAGFGMAAQLLEDFFQIVPSHYQDRQFLADTLSKSSSLDFRESNSRVSCLVTLAALLRNLPDRRTTDCSTVLETLFGLKESDFDGVSQLRDALATERATFFQIDSDIELKALTILAQVYTATGRDGKSRAAKLFDAYFHFNAQDFNSFTALESTLTNFFSLKHLTAFENIQSEAISTYSYGLTAQNRLKEATMLLECQFNLKEQNLVRVDSMLQAISSDNQRWTIADKYDPNLSSNLATCWSGIPIRRPLVIPFLISSLGLLDEDLERTETLAEKLTFSCDGSQNAVERRRSLIHQLAWVLGEVPNGPRLVVNLVEAFAYVEAKNTDACTILNGTDVVMTWLRSLPNHDEFLSRIGLVSIWMWQGRFLNRDVFQVIKECMEQLDANRNKEIFSLSYVKSLVDRLRSFWQTALSCLHDRFREADKNEIEAMEIQIFQWNEFFANRILVERRLRKPSKLPIRSEFLENWSAGGWGFVEPWGQNTESRLEVVPKGNPLELDVCLGQSVDEIPAGDNRRNLISTAMDATEEDAVKSSSFNFNDLIPKNAIWLNTYFDNDNRLTWSAWENLDGKLRHWLADAPNERTRTIDYTLLIYLLMRRLNVFGCVQQVSRYQYNTCLFYGCLVSL